MGIPNGRGHEYWRERQHRDRERNTNAHRIHHPSSIVTFHNASFADPHFPTTIIYLYIGQTSRPSVLYSTNPHSGQPRDPPRYTSTAIATSMTL